MNDLALGSNDRGNAVKMVSLAETEHRHIREVLEVCGGNKTQACRILGIGRGTLYSKLKLDALKLDAE